MAPNRGKSRARGRVSSTASVPRPQITRASNDCRASNATDEPHVMRFMRYLNKAMSSAYTHICNKLKTHFKKFISLEEARPNKPEEVESQDDWKFLCLLFSSEKFKLCIKLFTT
ncbi:hypothetical protein LguiB_020626 [Lonicera macranthoides]